MTLISKDGASVSPGPGDTFKVAPNDLSALIEQWKAPQSDAPAPPSYAETVSGQGEGSSGLNPATSLALPLPPPCNFQSQNSSSGCIKGTWVIDSSMDIPSAFRSQPSSSFWKGKKEEYNLDLRTQFGDIDASIGLVSGENKKATINLHTQCGKVNSKILFRTSEQSFRLNARTECGSVTIYLPRTFNGPLKHKTAYGSIKFSPGMQGQVHQFSEGVAYLGDWRTGGFVDYKNWDGDEVDAHTQCGDIRFAWIDEVETFPGGFIPKNFGDFVNGVLQNTVGWFMK
ncbi:hypothetical protein FRC17_002359 [Serendipita sp. 399]|nr:hypothetical protein FRC17_002359 [Serendipita sp. 399]